MLKSVRVKNTGRNYAAGLFRRNGAVYCKWSVYRVYVQYVYAVYDRLRRAGRYGGDLGYIASSVCADL